MKDQDRTDRLNWIQTQIIASKKALGEYLTDKMRQRGGQKFANELSTLLHEGNLNYDKVIAGYLRRRDFKGIVNSPFIQGFIGLPVCGPEEKVLIETWEYAADNDTVTSDDIASLSGWLESRINILTGGLQRSILDGRVIQPLSKQEIVDRSRKGLMAWREENPEEAARINEQALEIARKFISPRKFTPEVQGFIRGKLESGNNLESIVSLLMNKGVKTNRGALYAAIRYYKLTADTDFRGTRYAKFLIDLKQKFEETGSRSETASFFMEKGIGPSSIHSAMNKLGLRERLDWRRRIKIQEKSTDLESLLSMFVKEYGTKTNSTQYYELFCQFLNELGIEIEITEGAFRSKCDRILGKKK